MKNSLIKILSSLGLLVTLIACHPNSEKKDLAISDKSGTISILDYNVQFGNSSKEPIEIGLKSVIVELKNAVKNNSNLKGTVKYSFRCEPDGLIRWIAAGQSNLTIDKQYELENELLDHLMKKQIRFPELGEVTLIEATIKFE